MITVLYAKSSSINPSYSVLYEEMSRRKYSDLRIVDVSSTSVEQIERYCKASDLVVIDNFIRVANKLNPAGLSSVMILGWRGGDFYEAVWRTVLGSGAQLLYIASGWDLHWPGPDLDELLPKLAGIAWLYERRPVTLSEVPTAYRDSWMEAQTDPIENWQKVRSHVKIRIELIHSLGVREFEPQSAAHPKWDVCIAGDTYMPRILARQSAKTHGLVEAPIRLTDSVILRSTGKLPVVFGDTLASRIRNRLRQVNQRFLVHRSSINFVCGSGYKYPVRKFFEIPAARSALLSFPCVGMVDYGFLDGVHHIEVAPDDFGVESKKLLENDSLRYRLIDNAWNMVFRLHSVEARVNQLVDCMRRMVAGRLTSAGFRDGEFVIE